MPRRRQVALTLPPELVDAIDRHRANPYNFDEMPARQRWIEAACEHYLASFPSPQSAGRPAGDAYASDGRSGSHDPGRAGTSPEAAGETTSTESAGGPPPSAISPTPSEDVPNREIWVEQRAAELALFKPLGDAERQAAEEYEETYGGLMR